MGDHVHYDPANQRQQPQASAVHMSQMGRPGGSCSIQYICMMVYVISNWVLAYFIGTRLTQGQSLRELMAPLLEWFALDGLALAATPGSFFHPGH
jgi:hypothetical protein